jgi:hypothetical protein
MSTVFGRSVPVEPEGPQALPGAYQIRLTVDAKSYVQPLTLVMDPRVPTTSQDLQKQFELETKLAEALQRANQAAREIHDARAAGRIGEETERKLAGGGRRGAEDESGSGAPTLARVSGNLAQLISVVDSADAAPTAQASAAAEQTLAQLDELLKQWEAAKK